MWVAVGWYGVIDPNFFEDDQGCICTVHKQIIAMIQNFYLPEHRAQARKRNKPNTDEYSMVLVGFGSNLIQSEKHVFLKRHFNGRFVSLYNTVEWLPYTLTLLSQISVYGGISRTGFVEILGLVPLIN